MGLQDIVTISVTDPAFERVAGEADRALSEYMAYRVGSYAGEPMTPDRVDALLNRIQEVTEETVRLVRECGLRARTELMSDFRSRYRGAR